MTTESAAATTDEGGGKKTGKKLSMVESRVNKIMRDLDMLATTTGVETATVERVAKVLEERLVATMNTLSGRATSAQQVFKV